jgi:hypothetical protein
MEGIAIMLAGLFGLALSPAFCVFLIKYSSRWERISLVARTISAIFLCILFLDIVINSIGGAAYAREKIGRAYFWIHSLVTLSAAPALASVLLLGRHSLARTWPIVAALCWFTGIASLVYQYSVGFDLCTKWGTGPYCSDFGRKDTILPDEQ